MAISAVPTFLNPEEYIYARVTFPEASDREE